MIEAPPNTVVVCTQTSVVMAAAPKPLKELPSVLRGLGVERNSNRSPTARWSHSAPATDIGKLLLFAPQ